MLRTPSFFGPLNSGFVPDTPAAPVDALADDAIAAEAAEVVARAAAPAAQDAAARAPVAPWEPASSTHVRIVEGAVLAVVCSYFAWGLVRTLAGW